MDNGCNTDNGKNIVIELIRAGGWLMWPIILCSVMTMAIVLERFYALRSNRVLNRKLIDEIPKIAERHALDDTFIEQVRDSSPAGRIMAAALDNRDRPRGILKEVVEDTGRHVVHDLERFLNTLGTIAGITPLLGLLGTVIGMIDVFGAILTFGVGDPTHLAGGISQALVTTAAGLGVAIPAYAFYRYFQGRVANFVVDIEQRALTLIATLERETAAEA